MDDETQMGDGSSGLETGEEDFDEDASTGDEMGFPMHKREPLKASFSSSDPSGSKPKSGESLKSPSTLRVGSSSRENWSKPRSPPGPLLLLLLLLHLLLG